MCARRTLTNIKKLKIQNANTIQILHPITTKKNFQNARPKPKPKPKKQMITTFELPSIETSFLPTIQETSNYYPSRTRRTQKTKTKENQNYRP
jgi:hypothetical protein